jgi:replicative DNA helicase
VSDTPNQDYRPSAPEALAKALNEIGAKLRAAQAEGSTEDTSYLPLFTVARDLLTHLCRDYLPADDRILQFTQGKLVAEYWSHVSKRKAAATTGLKTFDEALGGGLQPERLVVLLGAPGSGKTTLANQMAEHVANSGRPVVYVTSEDPPEVLLAKTVARVGGVAYSAVLKGYESEKDAINKALGIVYERDSASRLLYLHDTGALTLEAVQEQARLHFAQFSEERGGGPGLLVIDYLQRLARSLMVGAWRDMRLDLRNTVTQLTERLRGVAIELQCSILALGSQSRASGYGNGEGALMSAKESGDIEYTADVMAILGKEEASKGNIAAPGHKFIPLQLAKNRQGDTKTWLLDWYGMRQTFTEVKP